MCAYSREHWPHPNSPTPTPTPSSSHKGRRGWRQCRAGTRDAPLWATDLSLQAADRQEHVTLSQGLWLPETTWVELGTDHPTCSAAKETQRTEFWTSGRRRGGMI